MRPDMVRANCHPPRLLITIAACAHIAISNLLATSLIGAEVLKSELVHSGGIFLPVFGAAPAGDFDNLYIAEWKSARIKRLNLNTHEVTMMLDLPDPVIGLDTGLNGFAFHPDFVNNGKIYVNLSGDAAGTIKILEYTRSASDPNSFDPASERMILSVPSPFSDHSGGWLGFGPNDGDLYIATGDEGNSGPEELKGLASQDPNSLRGKVLRIDVDGDDFPEDASRNYSIPSTNLYAGGGGAPEVFAVGLRHPFRSSFDRQTGDMYIGDVGSFLQEEVNFLPGGTSGGQNFGWRAKEGFLDNPQWDDPTPPDAIDPIYAYNHGATAAVIGGYVYRGEIIPWLQGTYFFGDFIQRKLLSLRYDGNQLSELTDRAAELVSPLGSYGGIASFAEDAAGELYMLDYVRGNVYRIAARDFIYADFGDAEIPTELEQSALHTPATFDGTAARFPGVGSAGRSYLRTVDDDLHTTSFTADVKVSIEGGMVGFFGLGVGDPHSGFSEEPRAGSHVFMRVDPSSLGGNALLVDGEVEIDPASSGEAGDGTYLLRMNYNATTKRIQFVIGNDTAGRFVPTTAYDTIDTSNNGFDATSARLFFGGADGITFDNLSHRYFEGIDSIWIGATDNGFEAATNWSPGQAPDDSTNIYFTEAANSFAVELTGSRTINCVTFAGDTAYSLEGGSLSLRSGDLAVVGSGEHTIESDIAVLANGKWDIAPDASITLHGALTDGANDYRVELVGGGELALDGSVVSVAGVAVEEGTVIARAGATVTTNDVQMASEAGGNAVVFISGAGTTWASGDSVVGGSGQAAFSVNTGAEALAANMIVGGSSGGHGAISVTGTGSILSVTSITLGIDGSTAALDVTDGAEFIVSGGTVLAAGSELTITDGTADLGSLTQNGGAIHFNSGSLSYAGDLILGNGGLLGSSLVLASNRALSLTGNTTIEQFHTMVVDGGVLSTSSLEVNGSFQFERGTLAITGPNGLVIGSTGPLGNNVALGVGQTLQVANTTAISADSTVAVAESATFSSGITDSYGSIVLSGPTAVLAGTTLNNYGVLRGDGFVGSALANQAAGEVRIEADKVLTFSGPTNENRGRILLLGGEVEFANSLSNGTSGQILGRGNLFVGGSGLTNQGQVVFSNGDNSVFGDVSNVTGDPGLGLTVSGNANVTFWDDVTHDGASLFRVVSGSSVTFFGTYGGNGSIAGGGDVYFESDLSPGSSPAEVTFEVDLHLGNNATTRMEIGGVLSGTQYDRLNVDGNLNFGGALQLVTINDFVPAAGDSFDLFNWTAVSGAFTELELPELESSLMWNTDELYASGAVRIVLAGDYNADGVVDAADYTVWRDSVGKIGDALAADGDMSRTVDDGDYEVWKQVFTSGIAGGGGISATVPEPPLCIAVLWALMLLPARYRVVGVGAV